MLIFNKSWLVRLSLLLNRRILQCYVLHLILLNVWHVVSIIVPSVFFAELVLAAFVAFALFLTLLILLPIPDVLVVVIVVEGLVVVMLAAIILVERASSGVGIHVVVIVVKGLLILVVRVATLPVIALIAISIASLDFISLFAFLLLLGWLLCFAGLTP